MENTFETFNKNFFSITKPKIQWFDKMGILPTNNTNIVVEIKLDDVGHKDNFNGYHISILHKVNGKIITHFFKFKDYLTMTKIDGCDYCHGWFNNGKIDWYINRPTNSREMVSKMLDYIENFVEIKRK